MDVILIGAGVAGLAAACRLREKGLRVLLLEKSARWGGCVHTVRQNGFLLERGPNTFLGNQETIQKWIKDLNLEQAVVAASPRARKRYVWKNSKLIPVPKSPLGFLTTPLLTLRGKFRFLAEPWIEPNGAEEESVAEFVARRFGKEALELVEPMTRGIYAADPARLSLEAIAPRVHQWETEYGSLLKALRQTRYFSRAKEIYSFQNGMQTLADALFEKIRGDCHLESENIQLQKISKQWRVRWSHRGNIYEEIAPELFLSVPAYAAATLLNDFDSRLSSLLDEIFYVPMVVTHLVLSRKEMEHPPEGFGFLTGRNEKTPLLGSIWSSSLFENRCNPATALWTCFSGGAFHPDVLNKPDSFWTAFFEKELKTLFRRPLRMEQAFCHSVPKAIPQYNRGHTERILEIEKRAKALGGLTLAGNYFTGVSVDNTLQNAADRVEGLFV